MVKSEGAIIWSKSNAGELFPFAATPMTFAVSEKFIKALLAPFMDNFGIDIEKTRPFGLVAGRIYINMNCAAALLKKATFSLKKNFADLFGGDCDELARALEILKSSPAAGVEFSHMKLILSLPRTACGFVSQNLSAKRFEMAPDFIETVEKYMRADFKNYPDGSLLAVIDDLAKLLRRSTEKSWPVVLSAMIASSLVHAFAGNEKANILLSCSKGMDSAQAGRELLKLAAAAEKLGVAPLLLECHSFAETEAALKSSGAGLTFLSNFARFMKTHGHHALGEVDAACPRWSEIPDYILSVIKSYLSAGPAGSALRRCEKLRAVNISEASRIWKGLNYNPFKPLLKFLADTAKRGLTFRENYKSRLVMMIAIIRKILLECERRLSAKSILKNEGDVFFVDLSELESLMSRGKTSSEITAAINDRKKEYESFQKIEPPSVVIGDFDPAGRDNIRGKTVRDEEPAAANAGVAYKGIAVSAGVVTGRARVVKSAEAAETVNGEEILVAPFTDPGWTPYFVNAAGLVTELGGPLSHGSIIAREYGIPAVVNVKNITGLVKTGQLIKVDGNKGTVTII
ncbi:MAG TPA: PEP-utilizing enzyme [Candidatus Wallbacteria bacterium]|nr:PEP-utilizing enzyme [Candidatus Wallbacteria bacterium]